MTNKHNKSKNSPPFPFFFPWLKHNMEAAVKEGNAKKLSELMRQDPGFDVNKDLGRGSTLLHHACFEDSRSAVIPLLLAHPDIDVNVKDRGGFTAFMNACSKGSTFCVREMLKDSRVKVNEPDNNGHTPLWRAARHGHLDVIKWWIASGREMDLGTPGDIYKTDAIGIAEMKRKTEVATLLERFMENPVETRHAVRLELGLLEGLAADIFALVVFVSDGLLKTKATSVKAGAKRTRFFNIASQLPLELQMVLCFRQVGLDKEIIAGKDSEVAFKELARRLW